MRHFFAVCVVVLLSAPAAAAAFSFMPADHRDLTRTIRYDEMKEFLASLDQPHVRVTAEGKSTLGRDVVLVRLGDDARARWNILFYAQQHGDEISGKDALLYLIRDLAANPRKLPADTAIWILPMMNPDGAEAGTRANGAGSDLNRDHMTLLQPETRALHRVVQRVQPEIAVDCHEFGRDPASWRTRGWEKWPDITLDRLNNPLFDGARIEAADRWIDAAAAAEKKAGHPFLRYWVGGVPPHDEQRHSAPDVDSAMNMIGTYGGLSFIIEAAARSGENVQPKELGNRVDAYLVLLRVFLAEAGRRDEDLSVIEAARSRAIPPFIPVNYLWANPRGAVTKFPVRRLEDGATAEVPTANLMTDVVIKRSVSTPAGYAIAPHAAEVFSALLDRQAIPFESIDAPRAEVLSRCTLLRVEDTFDEIHARYEGRQIVRCGEAAEGTLEPGSLYVPLRGGSAVRAALLLEPASIYGLFQYPEFRALVAWDGTLPIRRIAP
jgi:hypothetical protein